MKQLTDRQKDRIIEALTNIEFPASFTYTNEEPEVIAEHLKWYLVRNEVALKPYRPKWRWSKVVGYRLIGSNIIYYNVYKQSDEAGLLALCVHEILHMIGYGHGGNAIHWWNKKRKMQSANYYIGNAVKEYLRRNK